jgi:hypothetical protein
MAVGVLSMTAGVGRLAQVAEGQGGVQVDLVSLAPLGGPFGLPTQRIALGLIGMRETDVAVRGGGGNSRMRGYVPCSCKAGLCERLYGKKSFVYPAFRRSFGYLNAGC